MSIAAFERTLVHVLELDLDTCENTYGSAPCTAAGSAGEECYNTYTTCQDQANFTRGTRTFKFCSAGAPIPPGEHLRPYIIDSRMVTTAAEIDPDNPTGRRGKISIALADEPHIDNEQDPYVANRAASAGGTYLARLLRRNRNYAGRFARLKTAYLTPGTWDWGDFTTELYIIDSITGPTRGEIKITLKDIISLTGRVKVPLPTDGKLSVALGTDDLQLTLGSGEGSLYDATGYVRVKGQIIQYTSNSGDVLSWPDSTYRSKGNTTAEAAKIGDVVQQVKGYVDQAFSDVVQDLLNASGITDTYIDLAQLQEEDNTWLNTRFRITAYVADPESVDKLLDELLGPAMMVCWWSPTDQKVKFKVIGPRSPADIAGATLTDDANLIDGSVGIKTLDDSRITRSAIYSDIETATSNVKERINYLRGDGAVDLGAESENEYNDNRSKVFYSRFYGAVNQAAMKTWASRQVSYYRDAPIEIECSIDPKDGMDISDLADVTTRDLVGEDGNPEENRMIVLRRKDDRGRVSLKLRTTTFGKRYAFVAPTGHPDYTAATEAERAYAFICNSSGAMSNGDDPFLVI